MLNIQTFDARAGGNVLYKAFAHPVAAEAVARTYARTLNLPTIITRLNVPYGDNGGWPWFHLLMLSGGMAIPVPPDGGAYHLIHEDDIVRTLPALLDAAAVPAVTPSRAIELVTLAPSGDSPVSSSAG